MEITRDTDLSEIIDHSSISSTVDSSLSAVESVISERNGLVDSALQDSSVANFQLDGENIISDSLTISSNSYSTLSSDISTFKSTVALASLEKEKTELNDLLTEVVKAIQEYNDSATSYKGLATGCRYTAGSEYGVGNQEELLNQAENYDSQAKEATAKAEEYEAKKALIEQRISEIGGGDAVNLYNVMCSFEVDENGVPTSMPLDFTLDSHHRLDIPGWGCFYEAGWGQEIEFHYDSGTNMFYYSEPGTDWDTYDYSGDIYGITPQEMLDSAVKGGVCPG